MEDRHKTVRHKTVGSASGACVVIAGLTRNLPKTTGLRVKPAMTGRGNSNVNPKDSNHAHHLNHIKITVQTITHRTSPCPLQRRGGAHRKSHIAHRISQILVLTLSLATASAQEVAWKKNFGGNGTDGYYAVTAVSDGIVAVGSSAAFGAGDWAGVTGNGGDDAIIVKYNNSGGVEWKQNFGGSAPDVYNAVTVVSDGIVAAGYAFIFGDGDWMGVTGQGYEDAIMVKYDNAGNVVWKKNFGGSASDVYNAVTTVSDGIVAVGSSAAFGNGDWTGITGNGSDDAIIVKYNNDGNVVWKKNFGGSSEDIYYAVTTVSDGVVAAGYSHSNSFGNGDWTGVTGKGSADAIIVKYDHNGDVVWKKNFGGSNTDYYYTVMTVSDGIVAGGNSYFTSFGNGDWAGVTGQGSDDAIMVKYDHSGDVVWKKNFGGGSADSYRSMTTVFDGIVATGYSYFGSFGNGDWAGFTGNGGFDAIIVKYNHSGDVIWKKNFGGNDIDYYFAVTTVPDGIVAANYSGPTSFGNGDWAGFTGNGGGDAIIVKYFDTPPSVAVATQADFSCPGEVVVTYDLVSDLPVDVTLYYSPNQCDWLEAISVTGDLFAQTTGTGKTITWYNYDDNVRYGKFFFKVEAPDQCVPDCVMINGVCWATRNLDVGGGFVDNFEDYGAYFQWGRKSDGHEDSSSPTVTGPISGGDLDGDGQPAGSYIGKFITGDSSPYDWRTPQDGTLWNAGTESAPEKTVNDPCPCGWRVPTKADFDKLVNETYVTWLWTTKNGVNGYLLTDNATNASLFLPAAGYRNSNNGALYNAGTAGHYWSSTPNGSYAFYLYFYSGNFYVNNSNNRANGFSVRCVAE
ncbi:MAG: fibrobacter succinogenes major paralogous domain-containing protein [Bacteroidales bacterium]|nr:fibrobacter succinogenes major paralogous domain-containing protein [Bacteroidales bacterium]